MNKLERLESTTLQSHNLTHSRLKLLASMAQSSEDHISRLGMAISISIGKINPNWEPTPLDLENGVLMECGPKHIRGKTLFKEEIPIWMALVLRSQNPESYEQWRVAFKAHWERGVENLMRHALSHGDWIRTIRAVLQVE